MFFLLSSERKQGLKSEAMRQPLRIIKPDSSIQSSSSPKTSSIQFQKKKETKLNPKSDRISNFSRIFHNFLSLARPFFLSAQPTPSLYPQKKNENSSESKSESKSGCKSEPISVIKSRPTPILNGFFPDFPLCHLYIKCLSA